MKRNHDIHVRLNDLEQSMLDAVSEHKQVSKVELIRDLLTKAHNELLNTQK